MTDLRLPSGAFLFRGKKSGTDGCLNVQDRRVTIDEQDLQRRRERQIWWVEALFDYEDYEEEGAVRRLIQMDGGASEWMSSLMIGMDIRVRSGGLRGWWMMKGGE
ncbi:hypothetical protein RUND412_003458 [Rhizina undulata]